MQDLATLRCKQNRQQEAAELLEVPATWVRKWEVLVKSHSQEVAKRTPPHVWKPSIWTFGTSFLGSCICIHGALDQVDGKFSETKSCQMLAAWAQFTGFSLVDSTCYALVYVVFFPSFPMFSDWGGNTTQSGHGIQHAARAWQGTFAHFVECTACGLGFSEG